MVQADLTNFGDLKNQSQLELYIQQQLGEEDHNPVRTLTFISDAEPVSLFENYLLRDYQVKTETKEDFAEINLQREIKHSEHEEGYRTVSGIFYLFSHEQEELYSAFTMEIEDFYNSCLRRYLSSLPEVSTSYLTTEELRGVFDVLEEDVHGQILVDEAVIKSPSRKTDILYPRGDPYYQIFNSHKVEKLDYFVDKVKFSFEGSRIPFSGFVSRRGDSRLESGSTEIYFNYFLDILGDALLEKGSIFENKSRDYGSRDVDRLEINFEPGTIMGAESNLKLIESLRGLKSSSVTVYHKNPYLHASVLDYKDGTTADVFITSDKKISIIPGFEATRKSLLRVCEHINGTFEEGVVSEGTHRERDFDDFFGG